MLQTRGGLCWIVAQPVRDSCPEYFLSYSREGLLLCTALDPSRIIHPKYGRADLQQCCCAQLAPRVEGLQECTRTHWTSHTTLFHGPASTASTTVDSSACRYGHPECGWYWLLVCGFSDTKVEHRRAVAFTPKTCATRRCLAAQGWLLRGVLLHGICTRRALHAMYSNAWSSARTFGCGNVRRFGHKMFSCTAQRWCGV